MRGRRDWARCSGVARFERRGARFWHGWHRHMSLVTAAAVFLAKLAAGLRYAASGKRNETSPNPAIAA